MNILINNMRIKEKEEMQLKKLGNKELLNEFSVYSMELQELYSNHTSRINEQRIIAKRLLRIESELLERMRVNE